MLGGGGVGRGKFGVGKEPSSGHHTTKKKTTCPLTLGGRVPYSIPLWRRRKEVSVNHYPDAKSSLQGRSLKATLEEVQEEKG